MLILLGKMEGTPLSDIKKEVIIKMTFFDYILYHSAKGSEWDDHRYVKKIDGVYYYPVGYEDGRTVDDLKKEKEKDSENEKKEEKSKESEINKVKDHFDQYLAKRGIDWRTLPKEEVDQMQRDIIKQLESGKDASVPEKTLDELAKDVVSGKFGNGKDREALLGEDYEKVQKKVNEMLKGDAGQKKISEVNEESLKKVDEIAKKVSSSTTKKKAIDMDSVLRIYRKNRG